MRFAKLTAATLMAGLALVPGIGIADPGETDGAAAKLDPDYVAGKQAIEAKNWSAAIKSLSSAALRDGRNADIQNHLGYAYRHTGQFDLAFKHYARALQLNPRHRGAHEYVGEACLMVNNLAKAEEHLAALQNICLLPCEEYEDLKKTIADCRTALAADRSHKLVREVVARAVSEASGVRKHLGEPRRAVLQRLRRGPRDRASQLSVELGLGNVARVREAARVFRRVASIGGMKGTFRAPPSS